MAGNPNSKLILLLIKKIIEEYSDEKNILNSADLIEKLEKNYNLTTERKAIYNNIATLNYYYSVSDNECNKSIVRKKSGFFLEGREFTVQEIRLLVDAVLSSSLIPKKQSKDLVRRILKLISVNQGANIYKDIFIDKRVKSNNELIFKNIDTLSTAINEKKCVEFSYQKTKENSKLGIASSVSVYKVHPYALAWSDDNYYLIGYREKYSSVANLRVDRIKNIKILDEKVISFEKVSEYKGYFDTGDYLEKTFNMFSSQKTDHIKLRCKKSMYEQMHDRFGDISYRIDFYSDDYFYLETDIFLSDGFISWIMQFSDSVEIIEPKKAIDMIKEKAELITKIYK